MRHDDQMPINLLRQFAKRAAASRTRRSVQKAQRRDRCSEPVGAEAHPMQRNKARHNCETATIVSTFRVAGSIDGQFLVMKLSLCDQDETLVRVAVPHEMLGSVVDTIESLKDELWERRSQTRH